MELDTLVNKCIFSLNSLVFTSESSIFAAVFIIGGYTMIEIKETLVIKSNSPKVQSG